MAGVCLKLSNLTSLPCFRTFFSYINRQPYIAFNYILTIHSHHTFSPYILTIHSHHTLSPYILIIHSHHIFSPYILTIHSHHTFSPYILIIHSHHIFSPYNLTSGGPALSQCCEHTPPDLTWPLSQYTPCSPGNQE